MSRAVKLSVVVPLFDEEDNVEPLVAAVRKALADLPSWELVLVDDGSRDRTAEIAGRIAAESANIRLIRLARNYGQTAAMQAGLDRKSTRLNSSHVKSSYAVFCLKKKKLHKMLDL